MMGSQQATTPGHSVLLTFCGRGPVQNAFLLNPHKTLFSRNCYFSICHYKNYPPISESVSLIFHAGRNKWFRQLPQQPSLTKPWMKKFIPEPEISERQKLPLNRFVLRKGLRPCVSIEIPPSSLSLYLPSLLTAFHYIAQVSIKLSIILPRVPLLNAWITNMCQ